jgi:PadR family transcriptional regulator PadR
MAEPIPVLKGTLDVLVLKALSGIPMHGLEITDWLIDRSGGELSFDESGVYQALYRMEARGLIEAEWGVSDNNRKARYYRLTSSGRRHLEEETRQLVRFSELLTSLLAASPAR